MNQSDVPQLQIQLQQLSCLGDYENLPLDSKDGPDTTSTELIAFFEDQEPIDSFEKKLKDFETNSLHFISLKRIPEENWATEWKKYFKPFFLTPNIVIQPSWEHYEKKGDEKVILLDPGMAFGTGQHDTTRFSAEMLCELKQMCPELNSLIDVGCGSGILSIIAKKIGFTKVTGIEIDEPSIEASQENTRLNPDVGEICYVLTDGTLTLPELGQADVVVANIIAETLCDLKDDLVHLIKKSGYLILSGIIPERETMIQGAFANLKFIKAKKSKDWHAYIYHKK